jgi:hypothetical protein
MYNQYAAHINKNNRNMWKDSIQMGKMQTVSFQHLISVYNNDKLRFLKVKMECQA